MRTVVGRASERVGHWVLGKGLERARQRVRVEEDVGEKALERARKVVMESVREAVAVQVVEMVRERAAEMETELQGPAPKGGEREPGTASGTVLETLQWQGSQCSGLRASWPGQRFDHGLGSHGAWYPGLAYQGHQNQTPVVLPGSACCPAAPALRPLR